MFGEMELQKELRKKLERTWITFFGRYGKFLPVQLKAIPVVLQGKNVMIISPTASGKTEAVVAPILERCIKENWRKMSILYISPTRALANDMYYRLNEQLKELGLSLSLKTGDRPKFNPDNPPDFLITTPESLDSLICRHRASFENVKAVVLDEIHLIDNTYRGDQMRILLRRLRHITKDDFNIYTLSATVVNPEDVGSRYLGNFEIVISPGKREIEYTFVSSLDEVFYYANYEKLRKLLIFCNRRAIAEFAAEECRRLWGRNGVVVHHGSLSKKIREEAEIFMKESYYGVCVATMTLEVGIDIGDIDAIVLAEVPWSISSLLQRIGRGNRRTQKCRAFAIFNSEEEKIMLEKMFEAAISGNLEPVLYLPDLSVVVQQIFSSLFANPGGLELGYFTKLFDGFCSKEDLIDILEHLKKQMWIEERGKKWFATTKLMDLGEKGEIHSNIPSDEVFKVIDVTSDKVVGEVQFPFDYTFVLAGKVWRVVDVEDDKIYVKPEKSKSFIPIFKTHKSEGAFFSYLPEHLKKKYKPKWIYGNS